MINNIVKVRLQYDNKTTLVELDVPRSVKSIKAFLRILWEAMEEPPIRLNPPYECKVELCNVEQDKSYKPVELHLNACPRVLSNKDNCVSFDNGKCLFYNAALNDDIKRLCAYQPESKTNS